MKKIASICKNVKKSAELTSKRGYFSKKMLPLQKINYTRQFESKLSLRLFAETYTIKSKSLQKN